MSRRRRLRLSTCGLRLARWWWRSRPAPYDYIYRLNQLASTPDDPVPLAAHFALRDTTTYSAVKWPYLHALPESGYTITPRTIQVLLQELNKLTPRTLLEFGCGRSTICVAEWLRTHAPTDGHLFSIEQDRDYIDLAQQALQRFGLADRVTLLHAPLATFTYDERVFECYHLSEDLLARMDRRPIDVVVIDGPSGRGFNRFGTLVQIMPLLRQGTSFFLDDALRTFELEVVKHWRRIAGVRVDGIYLTDRGLIRGTITQSVASLPFVMTRQSPS